MHSMDVKALTFDTGGTILDWHTGFKQAIERVVTANDGGDDNDGSVEKDWGAMANELRRRSLKRMVNLGQHETPNVNFDDVHKLTLDEILRENGLERITEEERRDIWWKAVHNFKCWHDFPEVLPKLRERYICASFTILSFRIIIDTARANGLSWDAVISCEGIGKYKTLPESYAAAAKYLQLDPSEILMVACHNFDLDAAKRAGFKTAFVRRPHEWGPAGPPDPHPNANHDIVVDTFPELAERLLG